MMSRVLLTTSLSNDLPRSSRVSRLMSLKLLNSSIMAFTSFNAFSTWADDSSESDFACPTYMFAEEILFFFITKNNTKPLYLFLGLIGQCIVLFNSISKFSDSSFGNNDSSIQLISFAAQLLSSRFRFICFLTN